MLVDDSHSNPPKIRDPFCDESFYSAENTIANFFKNSAVRTNNASEADYFYVPILSTCYLMTNLPNDVEKTGAFFSKAMDHIINEYPYWNRSDGRDHVFMFAQGFGARLSGDWGRYRHATFLVHNGDYEEEHFSTHKDIVVPPDLSHYFKPVGLAHPERLLPKDNFVLFGGQILNTSISDHRGSNYSGGVRQFIQSDLADTDGYKVTGVRSTTYIEDMMGSVFCLAPHGWHKWSPRPAYAVLLGCIPVVISEKQKLFLEGLVDYSQISYWVRPHEIRDLDRKLRSIRHEEITRKELALRDVWRLFWYGEEGLAEQAILYSLHRRLDAARPIREYI
ncbi:Glycosyltransferase, family GT47 [Chondrus crispus]|uniref:Glycosyltransferase, family GT47 n=1 Tax=Chondrus crispus TaxID=2769 RepID=R7QCC4_CHOCR|nr:Glycosyltransferase, family GT47 [Chondrus crispus]CDF35110.1 Glycosyltransferase, family GT47 [Chondrus crispus]|eukprot:XP_005714929.1 Glycosyltransferase, family GT47 [Chondrus crispus]